MLHAVSFQHPLVNLLITGRYPRACSHQGQRVEQTALTKHRFSMLCCPFLFFFKVCFLWFECECNVPVLLQVDAGRAAVSDPTGLVFCGVHHSIHSFLMLFVNMEACHAAFWMEPKSRALQRFVETCSVKICQRLSFHATIYLQVPGGGEARGDRRESGGRRCAWRKDATRRGNNGSRRGRDARGLIALPWLPITSTYIGDLWGIAWTNWS